MHPTVGGLAAVRAPVGLVHFDDLTVATDARESVLAHGLADAVRHEPSRLVGHAEHPVKLVGAHALLGSAHQVSGEHPLAQRHLRPLEHGSDRDGELLAARVALVDADTVLGTL